MNTDLAQQPVPSGSRLIGQLLRAQRKQRGMTGVALGRKTGMSQSKISKLEAGQYPEPKLEDIDRILNILETPNNIRQQIYREVERFQPQALINKPYDTSHGSDYFDLDKTAQSIRMFTWQVPALLQTTEFRIAYLKRLGVTEEGMGAYLKDLAKRQDLLWNGRQSFHFIMHQTALYTVPPRGQALMNPQMDRIERMMGLPNVKIGIVPLEAGLPLAEIGAFSLHDRKRVFVVIAGSDVIWKDPKSIGLYSRIFGELEQLALYGEPAKALMHKVKWN